MLDRQHASSILRLAENKDFAVFMDVLSRKNQDALKLLQTKIEPVDLYRLQGQCQFYKHILGLFDDAKQLVSGQTD